MSTTANTLQELFGKPCSTAANSHDWGEWRRNYREGGFTRYCKSCGKFQRRHSDPNEVPFREVWQ